MPGVGVEPYPGSVSDLHVTDHAFFVIRDYAPRVRVDQADQGLVCYRLVADAQGEVCNRPIGRRQDLRLFKLPLQIGDLGSDCLDCRLVQTPASAAL